MNSGIRNDKDKDKYVSSVITIHLFLMICKNMLVSTSLFFYSRNSLLNELCLAVIIVLYLYLFFFKKIIYYLNRKTWYVIAFVFVFIGLTFLIDKNRFLSNELPYRYTKVQLRTFVSYCLPLFILFSILNRTDLLLEKLCKYSFITFVFAAIAFIFSRIDHINSYSMSYGYATLTTAIFSIYKATRGHKTWNSIQFLLCLIFIFMAGSRGPLICIAIALFVFAIYNQSSKKKIIITSVISLALVIIVINYDVLIDFLISFFNSIGLQSRTIVLLKNGNVFGFSDRKVFHEGIISALNSGFNSVIGLGAFGGEATVGLTHGLFLDILANFGYIFGTIFLLFIINRLVFSLKKYKNSSVADMILLFALIGLPIGFFDSEFWSSKELWILLGLFISSRTCYMLEVQCNYEIIIEEKSSSSCVGKYEVTSSYAK